MNADCSLTPEKVLSDFISNQVDKDKAIYLLKTLIEKNTDTSIRLRCIEALAVLNTEHEGIFKILESCLVSDDDQLIREKAARILYNLFPAKSLSTLGWAIQHEHSSLVLTSLFKISEEIDDPQLSQISSLRVKKIKELSEFYGVVPGETLFYLELNSLLDKAGLKLTRKRFDIPCNPVFHDCRYYILEFHHLYHRSEVIYVVRNRRTRALFIRELGKVPDSISNLKRLRHLSLLNLKSIPKALTSLRRLVGLEIYVNNGKKLVLPEDITNLRGLRELKLSRVFFYPISKSLISLVKQNIAPKYIREGVILEDAINLGLLDAYIGHKIHLEFGTYYNDLKFEIDQEGHVNFIKLNRVQEYFLIRLFSIPEPIFNFRYLKKLTITENSIRYISFKIKKLKNLKELNLYSNPITKIPKFMAKLKNLELLELDGTRVKEIPEELKSLKDLSITYGDF